MQVIQAWKPRNICVILLLLLEHKQRLGLKMCSFKVRGVLQLSIFFWYFQHPNVPGVDFEILVWVSGFCPSFPGGLKSHVELWSVNGRFGVTSVHTRSTLRSLHSHCCESPRSCIFSSRSQWPHGLRREPFSPTRTLGSWVRIPLETCVSLCVYSVFVLSYVRAAALRRPDPPSNKSHRFCIGLRNWESGQVPKSCRAIERGRESF
jgi:hypothetical protein